ncbi:hypothetical protein IFM89_023875 [Coptis chinensis]|uniref:POX domain-containing protein n=1 Tax=Coptis chinensis TaxID=261450 RepID=A0A835GXS6_9MAGN|nr:hypothetical protein IFM89_023875 [Coptis chinensis]
MEELVSSFEVAAGLGPAKSYTALALQAMSRHFCSLREAIITPIRLAKGQSSQDLPRPHSGLSQLSLFDQGTRRNGASLQELEMIRNQRQSWRPTRGLPETSDGILRAWLFEHFLHCTHSCSNVLIEDCFIVSGDYCISLKSGWDQYGIKVGIPTEHVIIRRLTCISPDSALIALGSEMSGGVQDIRIEDTVVINTQSGIRIKTAIGRGGYVKDIFNPLK